MIRWKKEIKKEFIELLINTYGKNKTQLITFKISETKSLMIKYYVDGYISTDLISDDGETRIINHCSLDIDLPFPKSKKNIRIIDHNGIFFVKLFNHVRSETRMRILLDELRIELI